MTSENQLGAFIPGVFRAQRDPARDLPWLAKEPSAMATLEAAMRRILTRDEVFWETPATRASPLGRST